LVNSHALKIIANESNVRGDIARNVYLILGMQSLFSGRIYDMRDSHNQFGKICT
jgi:hypothetical protein